MKTVVFLQQQLKQLPYQSARHSTVDAYATEVKYFKQSVSIGTMCGVISKVTSVRSALHTT